MTTIMKNNGSRHLEFDPERLLKYVDDVTSDHTDLDVADYKDEVLAAVTVKDEISAESLVTLLTTRALDRVGIPNDETGKHPDWSFVAARIYLRSLYKSAAKNRVYDSALRYGDFYALLKELATQGIYSPLILRDYTKDEINELATVIDPSRDDLFTYIGLLTLAERYLAKSHDGRIYELPQERFLVIAMTLMSREPRDKRLELVKEAYWALSQHYMTVATPTMSNAGKSYGQLSSCFIDTVGDDLRSIYDSNTDVATLSKNGGGIGVYVGKVRARYSDIRGFKNVSSGVVPWIKQLNNTATSVNQLGVRSGAVAVYLDVWHRDIESFLDLRLNNGDERMRAHDVFLGVCIPDIFMEAVEKRSDWFLFDPHEVRKTMGWSLEDCYDENPISGTFRKRYAECVAHPTLTRMVIPAIDVMKRIMKSQLETGVPYMFYRDTVNRMNPNKHAGMVYCSNLCTEIHQNMSETSVTREYVNDVGEIIVVKRPGDFVVCNLSSVNLPRAVGGDSDVLERLIPIQVRMLDNVIDLNTLPVLQARLTNEKYRAVGLGTFGWHHLLALKRIAWDSDASVTYCDELYERIAYLTIKASADLAVEKGAYPAFDGSEWQTGKYFERRGYFPSDDQYMIPSELDWSSLYRQVTATGVRNGWLLAVAPNGSTAKIGGSTDGIDPIYKREFAEEKKSYKIPVTAPDLSAQTFWYYKSAYDMDFRWAIKQNAVRSRHIDQGVSFNVYVRSDIKASALLELHLLAWSSGIKTSYYVRSATIDVEDCEVCT